jgi:hypothetical protein
MNILKFLLVSLLVISLVQVKVEAIDDPTTLDCLTTRESLRKTGSDDDEETERLQARYDELTTRFSNLYGFPPVFGQLEAFERLCAHLRTAKPSIDQIDYIDDFPKCTLSDIQTIDRLAPHFHFVEDPGIRVYRMLQGIGVHNLNSPRLIDAYDYYNRLTCREARPIPYREAIMNSGRLMFQFMKFEKDRLRILFVHHFHRQPTEHELDVLCMRTSHRRRIFTGSEYYEFRTLAVVLDRPPTEEDYVLFTFLNRLQSKRPEQVDYSYYARLIKEMGFMIPTPDQFQHYLKWHTPD